MISHSGINLPHNLGIFVHSLGMTELLTNRFRYIREQYDINLGAAKVRKPLSFPQIAMFNYYITRVLLN